MKIAIVVLILIHLAALVPGSDPTAQYRAHSYESPSATHWLGTDAFGRDECARLLAGARTSLAAGLVATAIALSLGVALGAIAGYYGGWRDDILMRGTELFQALPWLYLLLGVRALLPLSLPPERAFLLIVALLGAVGWARPARLVRGIVLTERERDYVLAARCFGATNFYLLRRHILPAARNVVITQAALLIPRFILAEVTMSFLGLGVAEPAASWGNMFAALRDLSVLISYPWLLAPGALLIATVVCYQIIAGALEN